MRVLQIIDGLGVSGGAERSLASMAPHLVAEGVDLHVAYLVERGGLRADLERQGIKVHSLAGPGDGRRVWYRRARTLIGEIQPDLVHTTLFESDLAGRRAAASRRVPCVSSLVNTAYGSTESNTSTVRRLKTRAAQAVDAVTARRVARFHAVTQHVATVMGSRLHLRPDRIAVVHRGRDAEKLGLWSAERRTMTRAKLGIPEDARMILAVGRQEPQKAQDVLLQALPRVAEVVPRLRLLVAGRPGRATPRLEELTRSLGLIGDVDFLGMREDVPDLMVAADVFAFPSLWEGAGGTLLEAMALKCPIVSSRLPTLLETVDDSTAVLVQPGDAGALADGLIRALTDHDAAVRRADEARHRFNEDFTIESSARKMADLYRSVASNGQR